jgi:hypothetical protein
MPARMQLVGFGNVSPGGAGSSTLTFTVDKFISIKDLLLSDPGGKVTSIDSITIDGDAMYIGQSIASTGVLDTNLARTRFPVPGVAKRQVAITVTVSGAGTWGANALCAVQD